MTKTKRSAITLSVAVLSGLTTVLLLTAVFALPKALEAESGTKSSNAVQVTDTSASSGAAVKFQATAAQPGSCPVAKRTVTSGDVSGLTNSGYAAGTQVYVPGGPDPWGGCFPNASNTGVPAGTTLSAYTGSCSLGVDNTIIDSRTINCSLTITGSNVIIRNSKIVGDNIMVSSGSLSLTDSEVDFGSNINGESLKGSNITVTRANLYGGKRQVWCNNCTLQDSYLHGQLRDDTGITHLSAARVSQGSRYIHNTLLCDGPNVAPSAGCSANQTGYPDFEPVRDVTLEKNLYLATPSGYCSYGGGSPNKPYSDDPTNATYIKSINNVFQRGMNPNDKSSIALTDKRRYTCGYYGVTVAFLSSKTGFQFTGNMWDDGFLFSNDTTYPYGGFYN